MSQAVTIDNYEVKFHERYASDQQALETKYIDEAGFVPKHLEGAVGKASLLSKWEELFEVHLHRHSFANFSPPPNYLLARNRFFSYSISPDFNWSENENEEDPEKEKKKEKQQARKYKKKIRSQANPSMPPVLFEKEQGTLIALVDAIQSLNGLLKDIHARKLQYQKG